MKNERIESALATLCTAVVLLSTACDSATTPTTAALSSSGASIESLTSCGIVIHETFEGTPWPGFGHEWYTSYGFTTASSPVYEGVKSGRFELRDTDPNVRSEVRFPSAVTQADNWLSFSVYWPSSGMQDDAKAESFHQAHQTSKTSPPVSLLVKNGRMYAEVNGQVFSGVLDGNSSLTRTMDIGPVPKDRWVRFVIRYRFSYGTDGIWQIWQDGQQILNYMDKTMYPPAITGNWPTFKLGIYKWVWEGSGTSGSTLRIMYVDDVRQGDGNCTLGDM